MYEWLIFLHVLAAFSLVAAEVLFSVMVVAGRPLEAPSAIVRLFRLSRLGDILFGVGATGTLVFGVWLAIYVDGYELWDGWVVAGLALWAALMGVGGRTARHFYRARDRARELVAAGNDAPAPQLTAILRSRTGVVLQAASLALVLLLLWDMIYKPGA